MFCVPTRLTFANCLSVSVLSDISFLGHTGTHTVNNLPDQYTHKDTESDNCRLQVCSLLSGVYAEIKNNRFENIHSVNETRPTIGDIIESRLVSLYQPVSSDLFNSLSCVLCSSLSLILLQPITQHGLL